MRLRTESIDIGAAPRLRVEGVAECVAEEVHREDREQQHEARERTRDTTSTTELMYGSAAASIRPHEFCGGCTPRPRNDNAASVEIAIATVSVAFTMIVPEAVRKDVRHQDPRVADAPDARAASTNSFSFSDKHLRAYDPRARYVQLIAASTRDDRRVTVAEVLHGNREQCEVGQDQERGR